MEEDENMTALVYRMDDTLKKYRNDVMDIGGDFTNEDCTGTSWSWASKYLLILPGKEEPSWCNLN